MSVLFDITSGWTGTLGPFTLKINNAAVDLTSLTVVAVIRNASGTLITPGGTLTKDPDQVTNKGQLTYAPAATDFVFGGNVRTTRESHQLHFQATDGTGKIVFFPNGEASEIGVYRT